jgi:hypothetical protein
VGIAQTPEDSFAMILTDVTETIGRTPLLNSLDALA